MISIDRTSGDCEPVTTVGMNGRSQCSGENGCDGGGDSPRRPCAAHVYGVKRTCGPAIMAGAPKARPLSAPDPTRMTFDVFHGEILKAPAGGSAEDTASILSNKIKRIGSYSWPTALYKRRFWW
jgi:hypothetical protein